MEVPKARHENRHGSGSGLGMLGREGGGRADAADLGVILVHDGFVPREAAAETYVARMRTSAAMLKAVAVVVSVR